MRDAKQKLLWVEWVPMPQLITGGKHVPVTLKKQPSRVWTVFTHTNKDEPPSLPLKPIHNHTAFLEDYVHDWNYNGSTFRYYTRVMDRSVWLLLEYDPPKKRTKKL